MVPRPQNADTSMNSVERGRWKLVISTSTHLNAIAGRDENRGVAGPRLYFAGVIGGTFEHAQRRRADAHDPPAARLDRIERRRRLSRDAAPFGMHFMIGGIVGLHGQKRARADMQRDEVFGYPARVKRREQFRA